jgi:hypothetical protein
VEKETAVTNPLSWAIFISPGRVLIPATVNAYGDRYSMNGYAHRIALIASLAASLILTACGGGGPIARGEAPLNAEEMKQALVGNSVVGANWDGPFVVYFPVYGEIRGLRAAHYKDVGTWRGEEDAFCADWDNWWGSVERCWGIYLEGDTISWIRADSDTPTEAEIVEGNPYGL